MVAAASQAWNSPMLEKEGVALKTLVTGDCSPERGGAGIPSPWGPAPERTQEPSTAETPPEETRKDSGSRANSIFQPVDLCLLSPAVSAYTAA